MTIQNIEVSSSQLETRTLSSAPAIDLSSSDNHQDVNDGKDGGTPAVPDSHAEGEGELVNEEKTGDTRFNLNKVREAAGKIVDDSRFQIFIIVLILINAVMMGIATFDFVTEDPSVKSIFEVIDKVFLIIFTAELGLQFIYRGLRLFTDGWLIFDFVIILMSWSLESLQIVRTFRVFRALRLITRVKVLKNLVSALFSVGPRIFAILCLLLLVFYIYGVMCTVLFKDLYVEGLTTHNYFSRLDFSLWSLLVIMTLDWANIARQVMAVYWWSWVVFVSFVMITSFIAYNLIIAVVCDSVSIIEHQNMADEEEEEIVQEVAQCARIRKLKHRVTKLAKQQQTVLETLQEVLGQQNISSIAPAVKSKDHKARGTSARNGKF